jgi:hypothetical protein
MKTTLELPEDVARLLRMESAKRGGRKQASLSKLVTDAVRIVYAPQQSMEPKIDLVPGRVIVRKSNQATPVTSEEVKRALWDEL